MPFNLVPPDALSTFTVALAGFASRLLTLRERDFLAGAAMPIALPARAMERIALALPGGRFLRTRGRAA